MTKETENALVPVTQYAVATSGGNVVDVLRENLRGEPLTAADLTIIKAPSGGATAWTVPTIDGDKVVKDLVGIIVYQKMVRAYWSQTFDESGGGPPDCMSLDAITGQGSLPPDVVAKNPVFRCAMCPYAQFGSGKDKSQACRTNRLMFVVREGDMLPIVVRVSPGSLKTAKIFLTQLASAGRKPHSIVTRFALGPTKNANGVKYSQIVFTRAADVPQEAMPGIIAYIGSLRPMLEAATEDFARDGGVMTDIEFDAEKVKAAGGVPRDDDRTDEVPW